MSRVERLKKAIATGSFENVEKHDKLIEALARGRLDYADTVEKARRGEAQFHDHPEAVAVTSIGVSGPYLTCYVIAVAGSLRGVKELEPRITEFARAQGCSAVEMNGRLGWGKVYNRIAKGYKPVSVQYRKVL